MKRYMFVVLILLFPSLLSAQAVLDWDKGAKLKKTLQSELQGDASDSIIALRAELNISLPDSMRQMTKDSSDAVRDSMRALMPDSARVANDVVSRDSIYLDMPFDRGLVLDYSGLRNDGLYVSATHKMNPDSFKRGLGAGSFNGVDDSVGLGTTSNLAAAADITIKAWIYPTVLGASYYTIVSMGNGTLHNYFFKVLNTNVLQFNFYANAANNSQDTDDAVISATHTWYHVVVTKAAGAAPIFYVNGRLVASSQTAGTTTRELTPQTGAFFNIGNVITHPFSGLIDEVNVYKRVWSANEVNRNYASEAVDKFATVDIDSIDGRIAALDTVRINEVLEAAAGNLSVGSVAFSADDSANVYIPGMLTTDLVFPGIGGTAVAASADTGLAVNFYPDVDTLRIHMSKTHTGTIYWLRFHVPQ